MKSKFLVLLFFCTSIFGQVPQTKQDSIALYFQKVKEATYLNRNLWGIDIYGPIILVNPYTRQSYSNYPDSLGVFNKDGKIYSGVLPDNVIIGNYSLKWAGQKWAMVLTIFLSNDLKGIIELFTHELFHRVQPELNFSQLPSKSTDHLGKRDGRIYFRLEENALINALQSNNAEEIKKHLTNAITFRKYRYTIYPDSEEAENQLELNEGIASYTGAIMCGRDKLETADAFEKKIYKLLAEPSYIKTFPYITTPIYGYLLDDIEMFWNKKINMQTNLTNFFIEKFALTIPADLEQSVVSILGMYNGENIVSEETAREENQKKIIAEYTNKFFNEPTFEITFERKSLSFDSRYLVPLDGKGIVHPSMVAKDNWGILTVESGGGLVNSEGNKVKLSIPIKIDESIVTGNGWELQLNKDYIINKDDINGNYYLIKK